LRAIVNLIETRRSTSARTPIDLSATLEEPLAVFAVADRARHSASRTRADLRGVLSVART
jgi:hypothetical protein